MHQYFKFIPYYNNFVSIFFGSLTGIYFWVSVNALISQFYQIDGNILIILLGVPIVVLLTKYLRDYKLDKLMMTEADKLESDIDSLNQITTIYQ